MPNDLLAELAELDHVDYVKQSNEANLAHVPGLRIYAGNDDLFARTLDMDEAGGILVASHLVGPQLRRMIDEPDQRAAIDEELRDVYATLGRIGNTAAVKAGLELLGHRAGGLRLPLVVADEREREAIREMLVRHHLLEALNA
jgi:4-hydroxy-tetrahydrodipicolinate synthase